MKKKVKENETDYFDFLKFKTMAERHKNLFGDVGFKNQFAKFNKEFQEYSESGDIKELADCYISIAGIFNYNQQAAMLLLSTLFDFSNIPAKKIEQLAFEKMQVNEKERIWHEVDGEIRHIDFPVYASELGFIDIPDGKYIARKYPSYGDSVEEIVGVCGKYLPSHYECVLRKAE